jgi:hypothetical protein
MGFAHLMLWTLICFLHQVYGTVDEVLVIFVFCCEEPSLFFLVWVFMVNNLIAVVFSLMQQSSKD